MLIGAHKDLITMNKNIKIRPIVSGEYIFLDDFLYDAIFIPEGVTPPEKSIIQQPELQKYIADFGKDKGDHCLVAEVDNDTPSLSISVKSPYRQKGIGTALMKEMLSLLKTEGFQQVSLSVQKANYASKMYLKLGFEIIKTNEEDYIMICKL